MEHKIDRGIGWVLLLSLLALFSCNDGREEQIHARLRQWDAQLAAHADAIRDSLEKIEREERLSPSNRAYHGLLSTIATDKTYGEFASDSLISKVEGYYNKHQPGEHNHIRSLIYQGVVRYRLSITDSTALAPLKKAEKIFSLQQEKSPSIAYLLNFFLGSVHEKNKNYAISAEYRQKALRHAKDENMPAHVFDSYLALFWNRMKAENPDQGKAYLDTLEVLPAKSAEEYYFLLNAQSVYYTAQGFYGEALEKEKKQLELAPFLKEKTDLFRTSYSISNQYLRLGQLDSAMVYALQSIESIADPAYELNHLLYKNVADIAEKQGDHETANNYRKEAAILHDQAITKQQDTRVLQLEKQYNLSEAENKALRAESHARIALVAIFFLLFLLSVLTIYIQKRKNKAKLVKIEMEEQKRKNKQQQFTMNIYARMLAQFFSIEKQLHSLANKERKTKPDFADFIEQLLKSMTKDLIDNFTRDISGEKFEELTGIVPPGSINKSELFLFFLITCGITNRDMAVLLKTSTASIRTRKSLLKNKLKEAGIDISAFESAMLSPSGDNAGVK